MSGQSQAGDAEQLSDGAQSERNAQVVNNAQDADNTQVVDNVNVTNDTQFSSSSQSVGDISLACSCKEQAGFKSNGGSQQQGASQSQIFDPTDRGHQSDSVASPTDSNQPDWSTHCVRSADPQSTTRSRRAHRMPQLLGRSRGCLAYGGDYNPEQWPQEVWKEDIALMREAGVNIVSLAIFSWDRIEPSPGQWDFAWLDTIIDMLGEAGIGVDLASSTAAAPMWLYLQHPEVLPVECDGTVVNAGSRQSWRPTSPIFRKYALRLCRQLAKRYGNNPYVVAWHLNNEYGWNNCHDYSDDAQLAFQRWCRARYGSVERLNAAWGTSFWSQEVRSFEEVQVPRHMGDDSMANPSQQLDFERFCSDALKDFYVAERDAIEQICPDKPLTTNFMISTDQCMLDYPDWGREVDFVANDHYFSAGRNHLDELLCSDALCDSIARSNPWYVMEHSTSAVQWKPVNSRKKHGELIRDTLAHVAMGADGLCFFQWRQSKFGAEAFHSAMLSHAGADSAIHREVRELGALLGDLSAAGVSDSTLERSDVAILFDASCEWATRCKTLPSRKLNHWHDVRQWYQAYLDVGSRADVVPLIEPELWSVYNVVVLPTMFALSSEQAAALMAFVNAGGTLIIGYATGFVDEHMHVSLGGYPGMLREVAGVRSEEVTILGDVDDDTPCEIVMSDGGVCRLWANLVTSVDDDAQVLATYDGAEAEFWGMQGVPAIVRHPFGLGVSYYFGCDLQREDIANCLVAYELCSDLEGGDLDGGDLEGVTGAFDAAISGQPCVDLNFDDDFDDDDDDDDDVPPACEVAITRRISDDALFTFYINRVPYEVLVELEDDEEVIVAHRAVLHVESRCKSHVEVYAKSHTHSATLPATWNLLKNAVLITKQAIQ